MRANEPRERNTASTDSASKTIDQIRAMLMMVSFIGVDLRFWIADGGRRTAATVRLLPSAVCYPPSKSWKHLSLIPFVEVLVNAAYPVRVAGVHDVDQHLPCFPIDI